LALCSTSASAFSSEPFLPPSTLISDYRAADFVLLTHGVKTWTDPNNFRHTEIALDEIVKPHATLKGKQSITIQMELPLKLQQFLVFGAYEKDKNRFTLFRGEEVVPGSSLKDYFLKAVKLKDAKTAERLRYHFDFLDHKETTISEDAYYEIYRMPRKEIMTSARTLPADKIVGWLQDEKTTSGRWRLYGLLLGASGTAKHAGLLRELAWSSIKNKQFCDHLLTGYVMLQPKEGWEMVRSLLSDAKHDFLTRSSALSAAELLHGERPGLIEPKELTAGMALLLDQPDMADLGIEALRRAKCWERTEQVLALHKKGGFESDLIMRRIMNFALRSPNPSAAAFVKEQRSRDAEFVSDTEKLLKLEESGEMR
jgi:hypothetical protein